MYLDMEAPETLPRVLNLHPAARFTGEQVNNYRAHMEGGYGAYGAIKDILFHLIRLRRGLVTWAFDLPVPQLLGRPAQTVRFCRPTFVAPLTVLKIAGGFWIPKIIISTCNEMNLDLREHIALSAACRSSAIETMCITERRIASGYLESKEFKLALNGAFFCDGAANRVVFCPALRGCGLYQWPAA